MPPATRSPQRLRRLLRQPALFIWSCYVLSIPFYILPAGLPQPGDALVLVLVPVVLLRWKGRLSAVSNEAFRALVFFTVWVCVVDLVWGLILWNFGKNVLFPFYYLYNLFIFLTVLVLYERHGESFLRLTVQLVYASIGLLVVASIFHRGAGSRHALYFDNPNQLGYYALLAACTIAILRRRLRISILKSGLGLTMCAYLALLSASRSALAGIVLLVVLLTFANPRLILVACLAALSLSVLGPVDQSFDTVEERISENRNPNLDFFEQRGYDRIWNNKEYLLVGASEGNNHRFTSTTAIGGAEIHSSVGTVLFSYGLLGMGFFLYFLWAVIRGAYVRPVLMLLPAMFYWVAHQGLRFTMLWIVLALFVALKAEVATRMRSAAPSLARTP